MPRFLILVFASVALAGPPPTASSPWYTDPSGNVRTKDADAPVVIGNTGHKIERSGDDLVFTDPNNPAGVSLSDLLAGAGGLVTGDIDTLAELNDILTDANLYDWTADQGDLISIHINNIPDLSSLYLTPAGLTSTLGAAYDTEAELDAMFAGKIDVIADPNANVLRGWDDTDGAEVFWTLGSGLFYDHATHTLSATGSDAFTVKVDAAATAAYLYDGGSGAIRAGTNVTIDDNGDYITINASLAGGAVDTSGIPVQYNIARFVDADTLEGLTYAELAVVAGFESAL